MRVVKGGTITLQADGRLRYEGFVLDAMEMPIDIERINRLMQRRFAVEERRRQREAGTA